jgi:hypothetical protein
LTRAVRATSSWHRSLAASVHLAPARWYDDRIPRDAWQGWPVQDIINFLYDIRGEMFYYALMGLVLVWVADLFGLWSKWGR